MGIARGVLVAAFSVPLLCDQPPALVAAFNAPATAFRGHHLLNGRRRCRVLSQALSSESEHSHDDGTTRSAVRDGAGPGRAKDITAKARRRARGAASQTRARIGDPLPTSDIERRATMTPTLAPPRQGVTLTTSPARSPSPSRVPPPQQSAKRRGPPKPRRTASSPSPPAEQEQGELTSSVEVDAMQRRVREILDEYCSKAPPVEQWPPGRRIRVRGVNIYYKDTGSRGRGVTRRMTKDRPTFVLLHGLAGSTASWDEVVPELSEYGRVISFDRPGFGMTERVMPPSGLPWRLCPQTLGENPYSADFASKVLFGILDRLGVDKVILVAHSLGAQVALRAARTRPLMVRAMILVAPAVLNPLDNKFVMGRDPNANLFSPIVNLRTRVEMTAKLAAFNLQLLQPGEVPLETVRNMTLNGDVEARVQQNFHDRSIPSDRPELISKYIEPLRDPLWDRGLLHFYKSLQGEVQPGEQLLQKALDVWKGPSMIVTGDNDPTVPTQSSVYVAEAMEGRLVVMESCAHIPMDEKSEVFTSAVLSFVNSEEVVGALLGDGKRANTWW